LLALAVEWLMWRVIFTIAYLLGSNSAISYTRTLAWLLSMRANFRLFLAPL